MNPDPRQSIRFCPVCGAEKFVEQIPRRDDKPRPVCGACGYVHYVGPVLAAGAILHDDERVCLVRRAWEPGRGLWGFPGGFVDLEESVQDAAAREVFEETGCRSRIGELLGIYPSEGPGGKRVQIAVFEATPESLAEGGCEEVEEVRWFRPAEIPWDHFAFATTAEALRSFVSRFDRA